jgi:hypothetical protein
VPKDREFQSLQNCQVCFSNKFSLSVQNFKDGRPLNHPTATGQKTKEKMGNFLIQVSLKFQLHHEILHKILHLWIHVSKFWKKYLGETVLKYKM